MHVLDQPHRVPHTGDVAMESAAEPPLADDQDEPPEAQPISKLPWPPLACSSTKVFPAAGRRESLLTRQLHSETEHTDDDRTGRTQRADSTPSNHSTASTAELTSDDSHSAVGPERSPPSGGIVTHALPLHASGKLPEACATETAINPESTARKRSIKFACPGMQEGPRDKTSTAHATLATVEERPKKKCSLSFMCPSGSRRDDASKPTVKRLVSPPPLARRPSSNLRIQPSEVPREPDDDVPLSPKTVCKTPAPTEHIPVPTPEKSLRRKYSAEDSDDDREATRFFEFATSEGETEDWVQESTCHRSRLTVNDTLQKENVIRKACQEVEDEAVEEEEEEEEEGEEEDAALADEGEDDAGDDVLGVNSESDDGFHSDDEEGLSSDSDEDDESDFEWWKPGGGSTAATSIDHLDRLAIVNAQHIKPSSSRGSTSSGSFSSLYRAPSRGESRKRRSGAVDIQRSNSPGLPDSTDFVCGTLDEDRPLEQAFINRRKLREAAKTRIIPQDIDPTFPTSDPEMDDDDDEDLIGPLDSDHEDTLIPGRLEEASDGGALKKVSSRGRHNHNTRRSPRLYSPVPKKNGAPRSPPPPQRYRSPAPRKRSVAHTPPPPSSSTTILHDNAQAPQTLFLEDSRCKPSPAVIRRISSPPNSPAKGTHPHAAAQLAQRPQLTRTASLPRRGGGVGFTLGKIGGRPHHEDIYDDDENGASDFTTLDTRDPRAPAKRGAIDIVKGLDKKRQLRKEKLFQKQCAAKAANAKAAIGTPKIKPGRGAERMREIGLHLKNYRGQARHILSM